MSGRTIDEIADDENADGENWTMPARAQTYPTPCRPKLSNNLIRRALAPC
jgi:hypothetical protein